MTAAVEPGDHPRGSRVEPERVLAVCDRTPVAAGPGADGSTLIAAEILKRLAAEVHLSLAYFPDDGVELDAELRRLAAHVVELPRVRLPPPRQWPQASSVRVRSGRAASRSVGALSRDASVTYLHGLGTFGLARTVSTPTLVQEVDPWSLFWTDRAAEQSGWPAAQHRLRARLSGRAERAAAQTASAYAVVSSADAADLSRTLLRPVITLPNGVADLPQQLRLSAGEPGRILFLGALDYEPNVHSAEVLCEQVLPAVQRVRDDAHVVLVGRNPSSRVRSLVRPGVLLEQDVPDVFQELSRAAITCFPGGYGRGVRNSVLQALRAGRPVVASALSARSVPTGDHLVVRDSPDDVAQALVEHLCDATTLARATRSAAQAGAALPDWGQAATRYRQTLSALCR